MQVTYTSKQNKRDYMEDRFHVIKENGVIVAMVCDGHGTDGHRTAIKMAEILPFYLINAVKNITNENAVAIAIRDTIVAFGEAMKKQDAGSTLTGCLLHNTTCYVYNIGDSRTSVKLKPKTFVKYINAQFGAKGEYLPKKTDIITSTPKSTFTLFFTQDHNFTTNERARILAAGGKIENERLNGILALSRSIGDSIVGPGLSFAPDIYWFPLDAIAGPILIYTDGVYEANKEPLTPDQIYTIGSEKTDSLFEKAVSKGSTDNITIVKLVVPPGPISL